MRPTTVAEMLTVTTELLDLMERIIKLHYPDYASGTEVQDDLRSLATALQERPVIDKYLYSIAFGENNDSA